jgi:DNA repair exonuclease SbcCD nuclease subunit
VQANDKEPGALVPFSILHFSDLHLDAAFATSRLPAKVARRCREQLRQTLLRIMEIAKYRKADAITIAGDLFEREHLTPDTAAFLAHEFAGLAPTPVFIAPGNHDAAEASSIYQRGHWPENVNIAIKPALTEWRLSKDYSLWMAAHLGPSERQNFLKDFHLPEAASRPFPILLLHASAVSNHFEDGRSHAPLTLEEIRQAGFALALLGHYHTSRVLRHETTVAVYPGSPEPLGFHENAQHGAAWIELHPGQEPKIEMLPLAALHFTTLEIDVTNCEQREQVLDKITSVARAQEMSSHFARIKLTGQAASTLQLELDLLAERLEKSFGYVSLENHARPGYDLQKLGDEPTVRGEFVRHLLASIAREPDKAGLYHEALHYGLQAFEQEEITLR